MRDDDVAERVAALLDGRTIATAESCTAGRIAEALAAVEKASEFLRGGAVANQESIKRQLLGVTRVGCTGSTCHPKRCAIRPDIERCSTSLTR